MSRADSIGFFWQDIKEVKVKRTPPERTWELDTYLPHLDLALAYNYDIYTDRELVEALYNQEPLIFDIECYPNYFLIAFKGLYSGKVLLFELNNISSMQYQKLEWVVTSFLIIGFNSRNYDIPLLKVCLTGCGTLLLKEASNFIIDEHKRPNEVQKVFRGKNIQCNHIDLIELGQLRASLKLIAARMHSPILQDLPFDPYKTLTPQQIAIVRWYCINDLDNTIRFYKKLNKEIELRYQISKEYGVDVRSSSDAQIAEVVLGSQISKRIGRIVQPAIKPGTVYNYRPPSYIKFQLPQLQETFERIKALEWIVDEHGKITIPDTWPKKERLVAINLTEYKMGAGGLHSNEGFQSFTAINGYELTDWDVKSYYPKIVINNRFCPEHIKEHFLHEYVRVVDRRLHAQAVGQVQEAATLKITINGTFGKFGSPYSIFYSPSLVMQITLTGQLSLLMLIEQLELNGIRVVSANTDGVTAYYKKEQKVLAESIVKNWEKITYFETEQTQYVGLFNRDVNNYLAIKPDGKVKTKGIFKDGELAKNPSGDVMIDAIKGYLLQGIPITTTITQCQDITKFLFTRQVDGGAVKVWEKSPVPAHNSKEELIVLAGFYPIGEAHGDSWRHSDYQSELSVFNRVDAYNTALSMVQTPQKTEFLGKVVRWYYSTDSEGEIIYANTGNKVAKSDRSTPLQVLPSQLPGNIDYKRYEHEALEYLKNWNLC